MSASLRFLRFGLLLSLAACGAAPLSNLHPSPEALARQVLGAVAARDEPRLRTLALDDAEFRRHIWPGLPAARPERNLSFSYVWGELRQKSDQRLSRTLGAFGGQVFSLEAVRFDGPVSEHGTYRVHRDTVLLVRDAEGERRELRILGSMVETDAGWKIFSYNVDD